MKWQAGAACGLAGLRLRDPGTLRKLKNTASHGELRSSATWHRSCADRLEVEALLQVGPDLLDEQAQHGVLVLEAQHRAEALVHLLRRLTQPNSLHVEQTNCQ